MRLWLRIAVVVLSVLVLCGCTPNTPTAPSATQQTDPAPTTPFATQQTDPAPTTPSATQQTDPVATQSQVTVPDIAGTKEATGETVLLNNGLIPKIEYEHSDTVAAGNVIRTAPAAGENVAPNAQITLYISLGPSRIVCKSAIINWYYAKDEWQLYKPYIENGCLYVDCDVTFADDMKWAGYATAGLDLSFNPSVPATVYYVNESCSANQSQQVLFKVPLSGLGEEKPSNLYLRVYIIIDGKEIYADIDLSIEW